jgi:hypothetical protein
MKKTSAYFPNSSIKNFYPYKNCLTKLSPEGTFPSISTQVPPTTSKFPSFAASLILSNISGLFCLSQ